MTDTRMTHRNKELDIDDEDYLVQLLSKLPIVKWMPPISVGFVNAKYREQLQLGQVDYEQSYMKFMPDLLAEHCTQVVPTNPHLSKYSQQILSHLFPTQEWIENGEKFQQTISTETATRLETARLTDGIRALMIQAQARPTGICPIRENLLYRCFDEMIRLATIDCGERGQLMKIVQDDIRMTLTCYKSLLESAIDFGNRKFYQVFEKLNDLHNELDALSKEKQRYQFENQEMRIKMRHLDRKSIEERQAIIEFRKAKLARLKKTNDQFMALLDMMGAENSYRHLL